MDEKPRLRPLDKPFATDLEAMRHFAGYLIYLSEQYVLHATHEGWCETLVGKSDGQCDCGYAEAIVVAYFESARAAKVLGLPIAPVE